MLILFITAKNDENILLLPLNYQYNARLTRISTIMTIMLNKTSTIIAKAKRFLIGAFACYSASATALTFELPANGDDVVGKVYHISTLPGDTFAKIGRRYDVGYYSLVEANPGINPSNIETGTPLIVPAKFVLPAVARKGIVVNLAELRLYYFPPNHREVITYPVGIGREGWDTPLGISYIGSKTKNPTWNVPESIRNFRASEGVILPRSVAPGPNNPLGGYALRLASTTYLIHGTNDYTGVGRRSSSGCIRMLPEDVERLFDEVQPKTPINIVNAPYKLGWSADKLYFEAHVPLEDQHKNDGPGLGPLTSLISRINEHRPTDIDWDTVNRVAHEQNGIPQEIGYATGPWLKPLLAKAPTKPLRVSQTKAKKTKKQAEKHA